MQVYGCKKSRPFPPRSNPAVVFFLALAFLMVQGHASSLYAHPPSTMALAYDAKSQSLSVAITHTTSFPSKHYIDTVSIVRNGRDVKSEQYTSQPSTDTFTHVITVPASPGDVLTIKAECSIFGSKEARITIPGT